jgi:hypothetical protein
MIVFKNKNEARGSFFMVSGNDDHGQSVNKSYVFCVIKKNKNKYVSQGRPVLQLTFVLTLPRSRQNSFRYGQYLGQRPLLVRGVQDPFP